jgi:hypothetical protein
VSRPVAHAAFAGRTDPVLAELPAPVACLGIDEHRRGRARWLIDAGTGEYMLLADQCHTCFYHLSGRPGAARPGGGRTADDSADMLTEAQILLKAIRDLPPGGYHHVHCRPVRHAAATRALRRHEARAAVRPAAEPDVHS